MCNTFFLAFVCEHFEFLKTHPRVICSVLRNILFCTKSNKGSFVENRPEFSVINSDVFRPRDASYFETPTFHKPIVPQCGLGC